MSDIEMRILLNQAAIIAGLLNLIAATHPDANDILSSLRKAAVGTVEMCAKAHADGA